MNESPSVNFGRNIVHTKAHKIIPGCLWSLLNNPADVRSRKAAQHQLQSWIQFNNHLLEKNTTTMKSDTEINIEKMLEKIQTLTLELLETKSDLEKTKNELACMKMHILRVEKTQLLALGLDQKRTTMLISNIIEQETDN